MGSGSSRAERTRGRTGTQALLLFLPFGLLLSCLGSSCSLFGPGRARQYSTLRLQLEPELAAWLVADVCRTELKGADPNPAHAHAPILSHGQNSYELLYSRASGDNYRIHHNGRMAAPRDHVPGPLPAACPLAGARFVASGEPGGSKGRARDWAQVGVAPWGGGCEIEVDLGGRAAQGFLLAHLEAALAAAEAVQQTARLLQVGQFREADELARRALRDFAKGCCARHQFLAGRLYCHRAVADHARQDPISMRLHLEEALDHDPGLRSARYWLLLSLERGSRIPQASHQLSVLRNTVSDPAFEVELNRLLGPMLSQENQSGRAGPLADRATDFLARNDLQAALAWSREALDHQGGHRLGHEVKAEVHRRLGQHQRAYEEGLLELEAWGSDPKLLLDLAARQLDLDRPEGALRLLARCRSMDWPPSEAERASNLLVQAQLRTPDELACRILFAEGAQDLAPRQLRLWVSGGKAGPAAHALLSRLEELRAARTPALRADPAQPRLQSGYENAPGVAPLR